MNHETGRMPSLAAESGLQAQLLDVDVRWQLAAQGACLGVWDWDLLRGEVFYSAQWKALLGYDEAGIGSGVGERETRIHPEDRAACDAGFGALLRGQTQAYQHEHRMRHRDGHWVWVAERGSVIQRAADGAPLRVVGTLSNIHSRKCYEHSLREAQHLAQLTLESIDQGVIRTDTQAQITLCNRAAARMLGRAADELLGQSFSQVVLLLDNAVREPLDCPVNRVLSAAPLPLPQYAGLRARDGAVIPVSSSAVPVRGLDGTLLGAVFVFRDISETLNYAERLSFQARHDALTGLLNRRALEEALSARLRVAAGEGMPSFLLAMDIDSFKVVNEGGGSAAGDRLLRELSALLSAQLRAADSIARTGGDEFAVVLPRTSERAARQVADKLVRAVAQYRFICEDRVYTLGLSIGLAALDSGNMSASDALAHAGLACSAAKAAGRGRVQLWQPDDPQIIAAKHMLDWSQRLREALNEDYLSLYLQPVVDAHGRLSSYECLLRLQEPGLDVVVPGDFMAVAARLRLMGQLDRWVCRTVFALLSDPATAARLPAGVCLAINLTPGTLADAEFGHWLLRELSSSPHLQGRVRFELTETQQLQFCHGELALLERLRKLGFPLYLDDFGSGYNSFDLLKRVRVDGIKLDSSVIADYLHDPVDQALVHAAVSIARRLNLKLVAEGVESRALYEVLAEIGVDQFQGHLFGAALPAAQALAGNHSASFSRS